MNSRERFMRWVWVDEKGNKTSSGWLPMERYTIKDMKDVAKANNEVYKYKSWWVEYTTLDLWAKRQLGY